MHNKHIPLIQLFGLYNICSYKMSVNSCNNYVFVFILVLCAVSWHVTDPWLSSMKPLMQCNYKFCSVYWAYNICA
jgi:hypothetical protein